MPTALSSLLELAAQRARWVLVLGLVLGLMFQDIAFLARPSIPVFIALLLFAASFRIGPNVAANALAALKVHLWLTLIAQVCIPCLLMLSLIVFDIRGPFAISLLLVAAAAPISGSPNLVIMLGFDPAPAFRQLILGTALLPLTAIPMLFFLPEIGDVAGVAAAASRLLLVIMLAAIAGFGLRALPRYKKLSQNQVSQIDGMSAVLMALVVVGLMSAIGQAWRETPLLLLQFMLFAFAINFGLQWLGSHFWGRLFGTEQSVPMSVISGNRNVALYLTALPASVTDDLLIFIGCYQFPMYLTPLLLGRWYKRRFGSHTHPKSE